MAIKNYSKREINIRELYTGEARCEELGSDLFFPARYEAPDTTQKIKEFCQGCALLIKCRDYGLQNQVHGIWGGLAHRERIEIRAKLKIVPKEVIKGVA
jgi:hypothetical protein